MLPAFLRKSLAIMLAMSPVDGRRKLQICCCRFGTTAEISAPLLGKDHDSVAEGGPWVLQALVYVEKFLETCVQIQWPYANGSTIPN